MIPNDQNQQNAASSTKIIGEYVTDAYKLSLKSLRNMLECRATIEIQEGSEGPSPTELTNILHEHNIIDSVNPDIITNFCSEAAEKKKLSNVLVAAGKEPVSGKDGWFELAVSTGKEKGDFTENQQGCVNFKLVQSFSNIQPGQKIGINHPPTEGEPGTTITGETIPAVPGKSSDIIAGSGVAFSRDQTRAVATKAGRVIQDKNTLTVTEEFVVNGDVDLHIGHINFNGFVNIKGDVPDDFNITATKGINVTGTIGACQIESDGTITAGSVAGNGEGKITCKGNFKARYLNHAYVECWGDIEIEHEIRNSILKSTKTIRLPKGLITGGEATAMGGIEVKILGAMGGAKTQVHAGVFFPEADKLQFLRNRMHCVTEQIERISETLQLLHNKPLSSKRTDLCKAKEQRITVLAQRHTDLEAEKINLTEELRSFSWGNYPAANPKINILGTLKEQVIIILGNTREEIATERSGPLSIIEDTPNGGLRFATYSPLRVSAEESDIDDLQAAS